MKPPTCRLCNAAHWSGEPHVFGPSTVKSKIAKQVRELTVPAKPPGFDRKAYNREYNRKYMQERRAKAKAQSPNKVDTA